MDYKIGDVLLYIRRGVCRITEIVERDMMGQSNLYYVLKLIHDSKATIYVPINSKDIEAKIQRILSKEEVNDNIQAIAKEDTIWIENNNKRKEYYQTIISGGDRREMLKLIKTLYKRKIAQQEIGKKIHIADINVMKEAEKIIYEEFSYILEIEPDQVYSIILEQIKK
jgi:Transcriptional regulators, similar to M. xanthus CarD